MAELFEKMYLYDKVNNLSEEERENMWDMAIGLQKIDGDYKQSHLFTILREFNIKGEISNEEVVNYIKQYYKYAESKLIIEKNRELVSSRIVTLLSEEKFEFSIEYLKYIHKYLFDEVYDFAGEFRAKNLFSKEKILNGDYIIFTPFYEIERTIEYELEMEKSKIYSYNNPKKIIKDITYFTSNMWQIHPFRDGNTRTISVFIQKYLNSLNIKTNNNLFKENSLFFRNALVRSQYANREQNIDYDYSYLISFFENLLLNSNNELSNDDLDLKEKILRKE